MNDNAFFNSVNSANNSSSDEIDVGKLFRALFVSKNMILLATLIFGFVGIVYGQLSTPIYKSNALIQVEDNSGGVLALDDIGDMFVSESSANTEVYIIKSRSVLGKTVDDLNLDIKVKANYFPVLGAFFARRHKGSELAQPMFGSVYAWGGERVIVSDLNVTKQLYSKELTLIAEGDEQYSLWFDDKKLLSGAVGYFASNDQYNVSLKIDQLIANEGTQFTLKKISRLKTILNLQQGFKAANLGKDTGIMELTILGPDKEKISAILNSISANYVTQNVRRLAAEAESSLNFVNDQIPKVQTSLSKAEVELNTYRAERDSVDLNLETKSLLESFVILEADISAMNLNEADIARRFTKEHPNYLSFKRQLSDLIGQRNRLNAKISALPETQQKVLTLMRNFEVNQAIFVSLQNKSQELAIIMASTVGNVRILDSAEVFPNKSSPKKTLILIMSLIIGFILGVTFALIKSAFTSGIFNAKELELAGLNIYASIPASKIQLDFDQKKKNVMGIVNSSPNDEMILADRYPTDLSVEALRSLRATLYFGMLEAKNNVLMISSASPAAGKSFISANLSSVLAQSDKRILVIDADLRKGSLHRNFSKDISPGLSDYLGGMASAEDITRKSHDKNLDIVSRGSLCQNPSELLMNIRFKQYLDDASKSYDLIVIDTPPILAVTDAAVIGGHVGFTILIVRFEKSKIREVLAAIQRFRLSGVDVGGVVFNAVDSKSSDYYSDYTYESDTYG